MENQRDKQIKLDSNLEDLNMKRKRKFLIKVINNNM